MDTLLPQLPGPLRLDSFSPFVGTGHTLDSWRINLYTRPPVPAGVADAPPAVSFSPGEVHEYINGPQRSLLFRVRHGTDMLSRHVEWRGNPEFKQSAEDAAYYRAHPPGY